MSTEPRSTLDVSISNSSAKAVDSDSAAKSEPYAVEVTASTEVASETADAREEVDGEEDDEEEGECGFCVFMKGGGCKEAFVAWEECIAAAEDGKEDLAEKCFEVTSLLRKCMEANAEYYEPVLRAEKVAEEVATIEVEKELAEREGEGQNSGGLDSSGKADAV